MATTYTTIWRLPVQTPGDPLVKNAWGTNINNMLPLIEQGGVGNAPISITGLTTYTLTTANDSADQARLNTYNFTGAIAGNCTVTIPAIARVGWVTNSTTGGHNVILTTGSGVTLSVAPGLTYFWTCDATNIAAVTLGAVQLAVGTTGATIASTSHGGVSLTGTAGNDSAASGQVGEFISAVLAGGSALSLVTQAAKNIASISLTAGDWDVRGEVWITSTQGIVAMIAAISNVTNAFPGDPVIGLSRSQITSGQASPTILPVGPTRVSLATTTTIFLVAFANFGTGTASGYGKIEARRVR